jgi:hypothetical protein
MLRKLAVFILSVVLVFSISLTAYAANSENEPASANGDISIMMTYISSTYCNLDISSSGLAECSASVNAYSGTDSVSISMYLQKYNSGWSTVRHWTTSANGTYVSILRNYYVMSGYTYRVLVYYYAYEGSQTESLSRSNSEYY